jgi:hypothetical protein
MGCGGNLYFPKRFTKHNIEKNLCFMFLHFKNIYELNYKLIKRIESLKRCSEINFLTQEFNRIKLNLFCDYTPLGYYFQDLSILNWYNEVGKKLNFQYLIFKEYDLYFNAPINEIYDDIKGYDAGFVRFRKIEKKSNWMWAGNLYHSYLGKRAIIRWLEKNDYNKALYGGFFPGCIFSKKILDILNRINLPPAFCELRMPSLIQGMGYSCINLNYPTVQLKKQWDIRDMENAKHLMYHPVYNDYDG